MYSGRKCLLVVGAVLGASLAAPLATSEAAGTLAPAGGYASTTFGINWDGARPIAEPPSDGQNSTGAHNSATVTGSTTSSVDFVVSFPGVGGSGGVALAKVDGPGICTVASWWHVATTEKVAVHCFAPSTYGSYSVAYTRQGAAGGSYAYAQASRPTLASYTPDTTYQYATSGKPMTVTRQAVGRYTVTIPSAIVAGATVAVGASGKKDAVCRVGSWQPSTSNPVSTQKVQVRCDAPWGAAIDSPFVVVYAQGTSILGDKRLGRGWWINANKPYAKDYLPAQSGFQPLVRIYQGSPGEYNVGGTFVDCTSAPARFAPTSFILQGAGAFTYLTPAGITHNVCSLDNFL